MKLGAELHHSVPQGLCDFVVAGLGGGAGQPLTKPGDGVLKDDAAGLFPIRVNKFSAGTTGATGIYTVTYVEDMQLVHLLHVSAIVVSDGSAPTTALYALVSKLTPASRAIVVRVYTPAGTLTDLGTSDLLVLRCLGRDTSS